MSYIITFISQQAVLAYEVSVDELEEKINKFFNSGFEELRIRKLDFQKEVFTEEDILPEELQV